MHQKLSTQHVTELCLYLTLFELLFEFFGFLNSFSDEVRSFNEKNGLTYPCKVRFYGDHKKEQIEKYKNSHLSELLSFKFP